MPAGLRQALTDVFGDSVDEVVLREHSWFARLHGRATATTRRNTIYLRGSAEEFFASPELMLHEYFHVLRQWNRGRMDVLDYLAEWWRRGYWPHVRAACRLCLGSRRPYRLPSYLETLVLSCLPERT